MEGGNKDMKRKNESKYLAIVTKKEFLKERMNLIMYALNIWFWVKMLKGKKNVIVVLKIRQKGLKKKERIVVGRHIKYFW